MRRKRLPAWLSFVSRLTGVLGVALGGWVLAGAYALIPPGENPFIPLKLDDTMGFATGPKLDSAIKSPEACSALLAAASSLKIRPVENKRVSDMCSLDNAVWVDHSATAYSAPAETSCPLAATLYLWERNVLEPLAEKDLGQPVARIEHLGAYSCRRINGGPTGDPSQHAHANAIDVAGFKLADGTVVYVKDAWSDPGPKGKFLHELHDRSCKLFHGVLGPEYNALHHDHFHLDMGPYSLCR
jgi:hypothetical protein